MGEAGKCKSQDFRTQPTAVSVDLMKSTSFSKIMKSLHDHLFLARWNLRMQKQHTQLKMDFGNALESDKM
jgi:hypothetical protein